MVTSKLSWLLQQYLPLVRLQCTRNNIPHRVSQQFAYSTAVTKTPQGEHIKKILEDRFPLAQSIEVIDISGGCGAMFQISVESVEFKGLTLVKQHRLVNDALKDEIKQMHGLQIHTGIPPQSAK